MNVVAIIIKLSIYIILTVKVDRNQKMQNRLELYLPGLGLESESTKTPSGFVDIYFEETLITITDHA